ncbi:MAG: glycosyltransferase, partial [Cyanobacteria bacterium J055]
FGVVVIGRNEGLRLRQCLLSLKKEAAPVVYVDSGSTDGSVDLAGLLEIPTVELDPSIPFSAARARNEGLARLKQLHPQVEFVQFIDGDCELIPGWLETAARALSEHPDWAVVCGRLIERFPHLSIYNRLCNMEWNQPSGETEASGGIAMMRISAFREVRGFNPVLIAGEEPELCLRLRRRGWKVWRLASEMALHDAQMTRFSEWWTRSIRAGHAYAEGSWLHGSAPERYWVKESRSIWLWGLILPLVALGCAGWVHGLSLVLLLGVYGLQVYRVYRYMCGRQFKAEDSLLYALFCILGKFPQIQGQLRFHFDRLLGHRSPVIEYKASFAAAKLNAQT